MDKIKFYLIASVMAMMLVPSLAFAGDGNDSVPTPKERREMVKQSIKNVVKNARDINADSIRQQVAMVVSDEFSDTLFEWEKSGEVWDGDRKSSGVIKSGKMLENLDGLSESASVIAGVIIFLIFTFPLIALIAIVWIISWFSTRKSRDRNRVVAMSIERGVPLPPDYFRSTSAKSRLQSGLVWIVWGVGIAVFFMIVWGYKAAAVLGMVPLLVGLAKLITYFVEDRPNKRG